MTKEHEFLSNAAQTASEAAELLNKCKMRLETTDKEIKKIYGKIDSKIDHNEFYKQVQRKMDRQEVNIFSILYP